MTTRVREAAALQRWEDGRRIGRREAVNLPIQE